VTTWREGVVVLNIGCVNRDSFLFCFLFGWLIVSFLGGLNNAIVRFIICANLAE